MRDAFRREHLPYRFMRKDARSRVSRKHATKLRYFYMVRMLMRNQYCVKIFYVRLRTP